jgi:hypothetical protein
MFLSSPTAKQQPFTANCEYVGIDKIRLIYPAFQEYSDGYHALFTKHMVIKTRSGGVMLHDKGKFQTDTDAPVYVELREHGTKVLVEFNPSRMLDPGGDTLCAANLVEACVIYVMKELSYAVMPAWGVDSATGEFIFEDHTRWPKGWQKEVLLTRLDLARDIYSTFKSFGVASLTHIRKKRHRKDVLYRNGEVVQTMTWGSKTTVRCNFYNKSKVHHGDEKGGWFRFEEQARTQGLKKHGLRTLDGVTEANVHRLLWERWELSQLSSEVSISEGSLDFIKELHCHTTPKKVQTFLGIALSMAKGFPTYMNDRTISDYRKMGAKCGFNLGDDLETLGSKTVRIDFANGLVVETRKQLSNSEFTQTTTDPDVTLISTIGVIHD